MRDEGTKHVSLDLGFGTKALVHSVTGHLHEGPDTLHAFGVWEKPL
jgi:hypothetical protein